MTEKGVHLRYIQHLLGHADPRTTSRYCAVANVHRLNIPSLLVSEEGAPQ